VALMLTALRLNCFLQTAGATKEKSECDIARLDQRSDREIQLKKENIPNAIFAGLAWQNWTRPRDPVLTCKRQYSITRRKYEEK